METRIQILKEEKDSRGRVLVESNKLIVQMTEELRGIEEEKNVEMVKRKELENAVSRLNEEEAKLHTFLVELEKKCLEGEERQKEMSREIDRLVEEGNMLEKRIQGLVDEKDAMEKDLSEGMKQLAEQKQKMQEMFNEKIVLDGQVGELHNQLDELKVKMEESGCAYTEKIKGLESEVNKGSKQG